MLSQKIEIHVISNQCVDTYIKLRIKIMVYGKNIINKSINKDAEGHDKNINFILVK